MAVHFAPEIMAVLDEHRGSLPDVPNRAETGAWSSKHWPLPIASGRAEPAQNSEMNHHDRRQRRPAPPVHDRAHDAAESLLSGDPQNAAQKLRTAIHAEAASLNAHQARQGKEHTPHTSMA